MLSVTKPDIFCIPWKLRVCKFPKNSMDENYMHPEIYRQWSESCNNFRELSVLDPESKDMYHCHPHHFWKFSKLRLTSPSGPIRYSILMNIGIFQYSVIIDYVDSDIFLLCII